MCVCLMSIVPSLRQYMPTSEGRESGCGRIYVINTLAGILVEAER